jgi:hypothetical protein
MSSLIDLLTPRFAPMQSYILSCLDIGDIIALSRTCRALTDTSSTFKTLNFNINEHLKDWFNNPCAFRSVQGQCHALIGAPVALGLFMRKAIPFCPPYLYIYGNYDYLVTLIQYLQLESYKESEIALSTGRELFSRNLAAEYVIPEWWSITIHCQPLRNASEANTPRRTLTLSRGTKRIVFTPAARFSNTHVTQ